MGGFLAGSGPAGRPRRTGRTMIPPARPLPRPSTTRTISTVSPAGAAPWPSWTTTKPAARRAGTTHGELLAVHLAGFPWPLITLRYPLDHSVSPSRTL